MSILKKQSVAVLLTICMIAAAVGIGQAKARVTASTPMGTDSVIVTETPSGGDTAQAPSATSVVSEYTNVYDNAGVLSESTMQKLSALNDELESKFGVNVAVVTTNYGRSDLGSWAIEYADDIGLGADDFIVVLDISGDNYWLVQGAGLVSVFTDDDCGDYAYTYMEKSFAKGDYDSAVLSLAQALSDWYTNNY
jgi:uncharacterized membrane protein YgcG